MLYINLKRDHTRHYPVSSLIRDEIVFQLGQCKLVGRWPEESDARKVAYRILSSAVKGGVSFAKASSMAETAYEQASGFYAGVRQVWAYRQAVKRPNWGVGCANELHITINRRAQAPSRFGYGYFGDIAYERAMYREEIRLVGANHPVGWDTIDTSTDQ